MKQAREMITQLMHVWTSPSMKYNNVLPREAQIIQCHVSLQYLHAQHVCSKAQREPQTSSRFSVVKK